MMKITLSHLMLGFIVVAAMALRCFHAFTEPIWLDELHTSWVIDGSLNEVLDRSILGNQMPLYFWICWLVNASLPDSLFPPRIVSLACGLGLMFTCEVWVWAWSQDRVATTLASITTAIHPNFIFYSSEGRPYAMLQFLGLLQLYFFARWLSRISATQKVPHWPTAVGLIFLTIALLYTHVTCVWLLLAEVIYVIYHFIRERKVSILVQSLILASITSIACIPILRTVSTAYSRKENWNSLSSLAQVFGDLLPDWIGFLLIPITLVGLYQFLGIGNGSRPSETIANTTDPVGLSISHYAWQTLILCLAVPILSLCILVAIGVPIGLSRYLQVTWVAAPIFAAIMIGKIKLRKFQIPVAFLIVLTFVAMSPFYRQLVSESRLPAFRTERWQPIVLEINRTSAYKDKPVFLFANVIEDSASLEIENSAFVEYLTFPLRGIYRVKFNPVIPRPTMARQHFAINDVKDAIESDGCWFVVRGNKMLVEEIVTQFGKIAFDEFGRDSDFKVFSGKDSQVFLLRVHF
ncbi:MAG: hypothetical protein AAF939_02960 [Planctomycetota bacterium]